jgi:type IV secretory pathway VirB2 component (pilin)
MENRDMKRIPCTHLGNAWLRSLFLIIALTLILAAPALAQTGTSPWENAVSVLQQAFTSTIARGLSLVAIVVAGLTFAFGEGGSKRVLAGVLFGVGMAIAAVKFFSLSRQPKCIPIIATQSISSLRSALPGESWRTLLQTFRTKIFLSLSDDFSARIAGELCGREDRLKASYNLSESGHDANVSFLTGKSLSHKANITASKSYSPHHNLRFDTKTFMELRNAQSVTMAYDGTNPMPPMLCYLKPYYNDVNKSYFRQLADGEL